MLGLGGVGGFARGYTAPVVAAPVISSITPASGTEDGGTAVTIYGTGFDASTAVTVDGGGVSIVRTGTTQIDFTTPAHAVGAVDVVVTTDGGSDTDTFTYTAAGGSSYDPPDLADVNFENGSYAPLRNPWAGSDIDIVDDPTPRASGKVLRISYHPSSGQSWDRSVIYDFSPALTYNDERWCRARMFFPSAAAPWNDVAGGNNHNRKIIDWQGVTSRFTVHRRDSDRKLKVSVVDPISGAEVMDPDTGIDLADDAWHTIRVRAVMNSADGVRDAVVEIYIDGDTTPTFRMDSTTPRFPSQGGGSGFQFITAAGKVLDRVMFGTQLTIDSGDTAYQEYRYLDDLAVSTQPIDPA